MKCRLLPGLPYPTRMLLTAEGYVEEYVIPEAEKGKALKLIYPFKPVPDLDQLMEDIHEEKTFRVREYKVLRGDDMDWLVSPYYATSGGTVIDWVPCRK